MFTSSCETVCDAMLRMHVISIVDSEQNPISGIPLEIINVRTNKPLCTQIKEENSRERCLDQLGQNQFGNTGYYVIISSFNVATSFNNGDVKNRDVIEVRGSYMGADFAVRYIVRINKCDIEKVHGPDTIVLDVVIPTD